MFCVNLFGFTFMVGPETVLVIMFAPASLTVIEVTMAIHMLPFAPGITNRKVSVNGLESNA